MQTSKEYHIQPAFPGYYWVRTDGLLQTQNGPVFRKQAECIASAKADAAKRNITPIIIR